jgi:hypothetical protein
MTLPTVWSRLDRTERAAHCRALAVAARLLLGRNADALVALLQLAEREDRGLELADDAIERLPTAAQRGQGRT